LKVKDLMKFGFDLSEQFKIPILIRTTTRISHMRGVVNLGTVIQGKEKGYFKKDPSQFIVTPVYVVKMRKELIKKLKQIEEKTEKSPLNKIIDRGGREIGIITSGSAFNYVMDVVSENNLKVKILKLTFSYPFPEKLVLDLVNSVDNILVAEEVEPVMEKEVLAIIGKYNIKKKVYGKLDGTLPRIYEYNPDIISFGMAKIVEKELIKREKYSTKLSLPLRSAILCPGCPHRATYFALKKAIKKLKLKEEEIIYSTDIGCYALGMEPPYNMGDYCISMGSSIGIGCGFSKATNQKVISFIGDSTFFHAGIPPLINAVHNKDKILLVVMDNRITGMTGGQTNPGIPIDGMGNPAPEVSIEKIARGVGVGLVKTTDPVDLKETEEVFKEALQFEGVAVVITKHPCAMITDGENRKKGISIKYTINQEECTKCLICVKNFTCPAIYIEKDDFVNINPLLCDGCGVCAQVCPITVSLGISKYPELSSVFDELKAKIKNLSIIDAQKIAKEAGSIISENMVLLGAAVAAPEFPVDKDLVIQSMEENLPPKSIEINLRAFELGFEEVKKEGIKRIKKGIEKNKLGVRIKTGL